MKHWSFKSTANDFDGHRIVQEAMESVEGANMIHVKRKGMEITLITPEFKKRAARVGITFDSHNVYSTIPAIDDKGNLMARQASKHNPFYYYVTDWSAEDAKKLIRDVEELEAKQERTTVVVV